VGVKTVTMKVSYGLPNSNILFLIYIEEECVGYDTSKRQ